MTEADQIGFITRDWKPIPRIARSIPFGYEEKEDEPDVLFPVVFELEALEKAKVHLKQYSYRDVAHWLSKTTGRSISHMGLKKRVDNERRRGRKVEILKRWARRLEAIRAKTEALENNYLGAYDGRADTDT